MDADELANVNIYLHFKHRSRLKKYTKKNIKLYKNCYNICCLLCIKVLWRSLALSRVLPVTDFSHRVVFECLSPGTVLFTSCRKSSSFWSKLKLKALFQVYCLVCPMIGQDEPNSALLFATRASTLALSSPAVRLCAVL